MREPTAIATNAEATSKRGVEGVLHVSSLQKGGSTWWRQRDLQSHPISQAIVCLGDIGLKPLIDAALARFDLKLADKMQVGLKLFSRDRITQVTVSAPALTEVLTNIEAAKALPFPEMSTETEAKRSDSGAIRVVLPERLGLVKAWDFEGTRVQVEFAFLNDSNHLVAIRDIVLTIGSDTVPDPAHFKQFVDVTPDARLPSDRYRMPVVVSAKSGVWLCAELEGPIATHLGLSDQMCTLTVGANDDYIRANFVVAGNSLIAQMVEHMQKTVVELKGAAAIALPISGAR